MGGKQILAVALSVCLTQASVLTASAGTFGTVSDNNAQQAVVGAQLQGNGVGASSNVETFENMEEAAAFGMTGGLADYLSIATEDSGNKHLKLTMADLIKGSKMSKSLGAELPKMTEAVVSYKVHIDEQKSDSKTGYVAWQFMEGDNLLLSLYTTEMRNLGNTSPVYYTTDGTYDKTCQTTATVTNGNWHTISVTFEFENHKAKITIDEAEAAVVDISQIANKVDTFSLETRHPNNKKIKTTLGIDDFSFGYTENTDISGENTYIYSLAELPGVTVTGEEYAAGYQHPQTVKATLSDGETIDVSIDQDSWTSTPTFNASVKGYYTWKADIVAPEGHPNSEALKVSYRMAYKPQTGQNHDYENDFTFEEDASAFVAWGKEMHSSSGTGTFPLEVIGDESDENYNGYLKGTANKQPRGSRLDISDELVKGAEVSFDWKPISSENAYAQIMLLSPEKWHPYFVLRFDTEGALSVYTKNPLEKCATSQNEFEGSIDAADAISTGLSGLNKWYTVEIDFDYLNHTANLSITDKENSSNSFTREAIPIETEANGLKSFVIHSSSGGSGGTVNVSMGLDNLIVDFEKFGASDIVAVRQPADVKVARGAYDDYVFPTEIVATLGNGSTKTLKVGEWTSTPAFDKDTEAVYTWTAPLITGSLTNCYGLKATYKMDYTLYPFPMYVHNPNTLELEFGEALPAEFPKEAVAFMSDGSIGTVAIGEWTAIREFNPEEEGIYVYGANIVETEGKYQIVRDQLMQNENHDEHGSEEYRYDVYYRISYFAKENNYNAYARSMEYLDRGVYAIPADNGIFVSWRLLVTEYGKDIAFNIYRNGELVNEEPITSKTNYVDAEGKSGDVYTVVKIQDGQEYESEAIVAAERNYMSIPLQRPDPQPNRDGTLAEYRLNDAGVADVDGDGQYEIIVKWYPSNGFDSGKQSGASSPTIFDVYEMDGTALWRLNLGLELPSGAHFNQFMLYDLDENGKAELFIKTSDGSVSYRPNAEGKFDMTDESTIVSYVGDRSVVPGTNIVGGKNGHVSGASNEYVTVFNGMTGEVIDTISYENKTGNFEDWGDSYGNRSARYNIAIAYLPKEPGSTETIPAVLLNRGYYKKTTVIAYTLRDGRITTEWNFVTENGTVYAGKGNHNMSTGDMDNDGFDELVIGAMAIDHDGTVLWVKDGADGRDFSGHADAIHLAAMSPDSKQLYVVTPSEEKPATLNFSLTNAGTGARIGGQFLVKGDIGRGMAANITPNPGYEYWASVPNSEIPDQVPSGAIYNFSGEVIAQTKPKNFTTNWRIFWDGDLLSELSDSYNPSVGEGAVSVFKYNWENNTMDTLETFEGTKLNNSTKNTPSLSADILGDWREELLVRSEDNTELRIYMTSEETDYMIYTLMHDPVYRNCIANQNTSYNQPPQIGFYLGEDNKDEVLAMQLPTANVTYTTEEIIEVVDKSALENAIKGIEALIKEDYTENSWKAVEEALAAANREMDNEQATVRSVEEALIHLEAAVAALVRKPDSGSGTGDDNGSSTVDDGENGTVDDSENGTVDDSESGTVDDSESGTVDDSESGTVDDGENGTVDDSENGTGDSNGDDSDDDSSDSGDYPADTSIDWEAVGTVLQDKAAELAVNAGVENINVNVTVESENSVPVSALRTIQGEKITLAFHYGNGITLSITGTDFNGAALAHREQIDLSVNGHTGNIPENLTELRQSVIPKRLISVKDTGRFAVPVNLHTNVGQSEAGKYANLYRYNEQKGQLEYCGSFRVIRNGQAMFGISRGGEYMLTVTERKPDESVWFAEGEYVVKSGDSLSVIARRHHLTLEQLIKRNPQIRDINKILSGQKININE